MLSAKDRRYCMNGNHWFDALMTDVMAGYLTQGVEMSFNSRIVSDHSVARASGLGSCPTKTAYERLGVEPTNPNNTPQGNVNLALLLSSGTHVAKMYQSALLWAASRSNDLIVMVEEPLRSDEIHGTTDAYVNYLGNEMIVDFKYSMSYTGGAPGEPRDNYGMQLIAYGMGWEKKYGYEPELGLFVIGKGKQTEPVWKLYRLVKEGEGYIFMTPEGGIFEPPKYKGRWNHPDILNRKRAVELARQQGYHMRMAKLGTPEIAITDPLNDKEDGWQCGVIDKTNKLFEPRCAYAHMCHGVTDRGREVVKNEETGKWEF